MEANITAPSAAPSRGSPSAAHQQVEGGDLLLVLALSPRGAPEARSRSHDEVERCCGVGSGSRDMQSDDGPDRGRLSGLPAHHPADRRLGHAQDS